MQKWWGATTPTQADWAEGAKRGPERATNRTAESVEAQVLGVLERLAEHPWAQIRAPAIAWELEKLDASVPSEPVLEREVRELRKANEILKAASVFSPRSSTRPDRSEPVHRGEPGPLGVELICRALGLSASAYYEQPALGPRDRGRAAARAGPRGPQGELRRLRLPADVDGACRRGERLARCKVQGLIADNDIQGAKRRGRPWRTTTADPDAKRHPDLVKRDFTAPQLGELVVADFTYVQ